MKLTSIAAFALMPAALMQCSPADAQTQTVTYTYTYNGPALPIYQDSANIVSFANLFVPKAIRITNVTANVEIDYPRPGDLNVYMYSPILTRTKLLERNCGSQGSVASVTFDDSAPTLYSEICPVTAGTYRGNEPLANFNNQISLGTWSLAVENNGSNDFIGYFRGFSLTISGVLVTYKPITTANAIVNQASLESGPIAPGEMLNIVGFNLGPTPAVIAPTGDLPTTLGGVQVTFGGAPAAMSYASSYVLTVQVPFSLQPGTKVDMRVAYQNNTSDSVTLDVLNAEPGLFTQTANGKGAMVAVNPDGSINSELNPAPKGRQVAFYAVGLGPVTPALATGQTPPLSPLSATVFPVTAVVDGISADVLFAGAAPRFPGQYQVNLRIPLGVNSGARSLTLYGAGAPSQSVTIWVQ